jgi:hypothetical protein
VRSIRQPVIWPTLLMREGRKRPNRTVYIEHSVPIDVLVKLLKFHANDFKTPGALHNFLILHSVATALSYEEGKNMKGTAARGVATRHSR